MNWGATGIGHNNINLLSVNLDSLSSVTGDSSLCRLVDGGIVPCDLPSLKKAIG